MNRVTATPDDDPIALRRLMELIAADLHRLECVDLNALEHEDQVDLLLQLDLHEQELQALERRLPAIQPVSGRRPATHAVSA